MNNTQFVYFIFGIVLLLALVFDLGLISKKNKEVTIKQAFIQTIFWVTLALSFFVFMWILEGSKPALEYMSAYLMEWSLSIDNIFVFILIFNSFKVKEKNYSRILLIGILMAIVFRIIFISLGVALVAKFHWILYGFGIFLLYTGYKMFTTNEDDTFEPHETKVYKFLKKYLPIASHDGNGKIMIRENGKPVYTTLFVVVVLLATIDLVFAMDSIPAVLGISNEKLVIYTSNIFAVLGLRSLFFLLRGAVNKFDYLQQGIAIVLAFIGIKMLGEYYLDQWLDKTIQTVFSLGVILVCISGSIIYSIYHDKKGMIQSLPDYKK